MIKVSSPVVGAEELAAVQSAFDLGYFGQGSKVMEFEQALCHYLGAHQVVAVNTGTAALHLALLALGIGPGDEVIVPSLTFVACFQMIAATGALPVPCEVYPDTLLLDLEDAQRRMTPDTKALMPVHYAGNPGKLDAVYKLAEKKGLRVIEDAAHALGSTYNGQLIGSFGDIVCFSFDSIKNITCGEGGAVVCADPKLAEQIRQMRLLGLVREGHADPGQIRRWYYSVKQQGFRYHMSNINAAIGLTQLARLPEFIARRQQIARRYDAALAEMAGIKLLKIDYATVAPHIYVVRVKGGKRDALMEFLREHDIEASINYIPNHLHERFQQLYKNRPWPLPVTEKVFEEILTLPLHCGLTDAEVDKVIAALNSFFQRKKT
jgi:dTDP-4-amino-4,6-dideoxygalactose transaminase